LAGSFDRRYIAARRRDNIGSHGSPVHGGQSGERTAKQRGLAEVLAFHNYASPAFEFF
jgi:hypothetical protein